MQIAVQDLAKPVLSPLPTAYGADQHLSCSDADAGDTAGASALLPEAAHTSCPSLLGLLCIFRRTHSDSVSFGKAHAWTSQMCVKARQPGWMPCWKFDFSESDSSSSEQGWQAVLLLDNRGLGLESFRLGMFVHF